MPTVIPTKADFQAATNLKLVTSAKRGTDHLLLRVDTLLDAYHAAGTDQARIMVLGKLYFTVTAWLNQADRGGAGINTRRRPAVDTFFLKVVTRLCEDTTVPINLLPDWLTATFGKSMHEHGVEIDLRDRAAEYLTPQQVAKYRLEFRGGVAYQQEWWRNSPKLVVANSAQILAGTAEPQAQQGAPGNVLTEGHSGYVMSVGGDFYSGPHFAAALHSESGRYHSSYYGGEAVLSAGEIQIEDGVVRRINNNSGHYRPGPEKLLMAVEMLAALGVNLAQLRVLAMTHGERSGVEYLTWDLARAAVPAARGAGLGDTPLARHRVRATLNHHEQAGDIERAFTVFKVHWKPKAKGGHGAFAKDKCEECKRHSNHWALGEWAVTHYGGLDNIPARVNLPVIGR